MRLVTIDNGRPDGRLALVSADGARAAWADDAFPTLQHALERWDEAETALSRQALAIERGDHRTFALDPAALRAPLPRAWQWLDGSVYLSHSVLIAQAYSLPNPQWDRPLMYQGMSHQFLGPLQDVPLPSEADGIDFEGEFGVLTDFVPMGVSPADALGHIRLIVQINDWSLRTIGAREMETGYGWIRAKPACAAAPFAVTPDVLGPAWRDGRVHLDLAVEWNGTAFGRANGGEMAFGFHDLIAHAAHSRSLCAGTVIGSGTVSNARYREVGSSCIAERRGIEILDSGAPQTDYMRFGDRVRMTAVANDGTAPFGTIDQRIVQG